MFNVTRTPKAPACLVNGHYNTPEVVEALKEMFHEKCYLCEQDDLSAPEIEHLKSHRNDRKLKFDWGNLFYSCRRCNSIKSTKYDDIIDCTDIQVDAFSEIICKITAIVDDDIVVRAVNNGTASQSVQSTISLLHKCYNSTDTALRGVSRESLVNDIFDHLMLFLGHRKVLMNKASGADVKKEAEQSMAAMVCDSYPYAVFWRWHYIEDKKLSKKYPDLRQGF